MNINGLQNVQYHNSIKSTGNSGVYTPSTSIINTPLTERYTVGENIGRGKFAVVKKCVLNETGEVVAAKFIKKRRRGKSCREEILREVVMLEMALNHPRLVNLKEVYESQSELILITEYCAGGELFTECILEEKFNEADVRLLMAQILEGLVYLHEKNIVHLDLKPQNILLTDEFPKGSIKICDLGFACLVNTGEDIRDIIGTPDYVAPEVLNYDSLGLYTDMWSLGVLTYVMLTTCSPFAADDKQMTFCNITTVNFEFSDDLFNDLSLASQDFIKKLLILDPRERMTAKECLSHEWVAGIFAPDKLLTTATNSERIEVEERLDEHIDFISSKTEVTSSETELSNENEIDTQLGESVVKSDSRDKIQDQASEMSVGDIREVNSVDDSREVLRETSVELDEMSEGDAREIVNVGDSKDVIIENVLGDTTVEFDEQEISIAQSDVSISEGDVVKPAESETTLENMEIIHKQHIEKEDNLRTPDTESSMCISDSRLGDIDSGIVTGSDSKSGESESAQTQSGRSSTDLELSSDREFDMGNADDNQDSEMLNKSMLENELKKDNSLNLDCSSNEHVSKPLMESTEPDTDKLNNLNKNFNCIDSNQLTEFEKDTGHSDMDVDHSETVADMIEGQTTSALKSSSSLDDVNKEHSSSADIDLESGVKGVNDTVNNTRGTSERLILDQVSPYVGERVRQFTGELSKSPVITRSESKGRNSSVGNIDDNINCMQLGERHKRELSSSSRADNPEKTEEVEYEFISVSKRVKSYEDTLSPAKSPQFSPKIPRSPRVGRQHRNHHQHH